MGTYRVPVFVEVSLGGDEDAAYAAVDAIMQSAWDRTRGGETIAGPRWHFEMEPGTVSKIDDPLGAMFARLDELGATKPTGAGELDELAAAEGNVSDETHRPS